MFALQASVHGIFHTLKMSFNLFSGNCSLLFIPGAQSVVYLQDLWNQAYLTLTLLIFRYTSKKYFFTPLGRFLQISDTKLKPVLHNDVLEEAYHKSTKCKNAAYLAKQCDLTERQVQRWWRLRRCQDKPSTLGKFTENMWKGTFILFNFSFGLYVLWDKYWFWNMETITQGIRLRAPGDIWWYYMISTGFYWTLTLTHFWDVRCKDFWQMFVHHLAAIALLLLSWFANMYRIGSVVLLLHDSSDIVLELGKAAKCARLPGITAYFALFAITWIISRLILFPYWVLTRTTAQAYLCNMPIIHLLNVLLWFLLILHFIWTWIIFQVVYKTAASGMEPGDLRSSSSEIEETDCKPKKY